MNSYRIAVVGATGAVGQEILRTLELRKFPVSHLTVLASSRSLGKTVEFNARNCRSKELRASAFEGIDYALFSARGHALARIRGGLQKGRRGDDRTTPPHFA